MSEISYACSFGATCGAAELLKRNKWRLCAYPFDWVFSDHKIIAHCIESNFSLLLDKSQYVDIQHKWNSDQCGHRTYGGNMFNHRDMRNSDHYAYLTRSVERLRDVLKSSAPKLFVMYYRNKDARMTEQFKSEIINFSTMLKSHTTNFHILVIWNISNKTHRKHDILSKDVVGFLTLTTMSEDNGTIFTDNEDNIYLDQIINRMYKFVGGIDKN